MATFYKPGLADSQVTLTEEQLAPGAINPQDIGARQRLLNTGYKELQPGEQVSDLTTPPAVTAPAGTNTKDLLSSFLPEGFQSKMDADLAALQELGRNTGVLTAAEKAEIEQEAQQAGVPYDALIAQAMEAKRQGMASGTVRAGQRGGFESTQIAGAAALAPTVGGTFVGQGGYLEKVKSAYDLNINNLQIKKQEAINAARDELSKARMTGKEADFKRAEELYNLARQANEDAINLQFKKLQALNTAQDYFQSQVTFEQKQQDRAVQNAVPSLVTIDASGDIVRPSDAELSKFASENGLDPALLYKEINNRIDELSKIQKEDRKDALDMQLQQANIEKTLFATEKEKQMLPLNVAEIQSRIRENAAQTAKAWASVKESESNIAANDINQIFTGYANYFGTVNESGSPKYYGGDGKLDTQIYKNALNEFVEMHKTNKDYYKKLFYQNFPPNILLNSNDNTAQPFISDANKMNQVVTQITFGTTE